MSILVDGVDVPIVQVHSPKFTAGHPAPLLALVNHRMVGTLTATDAAFTNPDGRAASTTLGIGHKSGRLEIHQYVLLGDQAWANGNNRDASGALVDSAWNHRYPTTLVNSRTIAIEHEDNGGLPLGDPRRGIVTEDIQRASIAVWRLLLTGNVAAMKAAGLRFRAGLESAIGRELAAIRPGPDTVIDHHYIAGPLKPSCWRPWAADKVGFPQAKYLAGIAGTSSPEEPMGLAVHLLATTENPPADVNGTATVKGAGHSAIRVRDRKFVPVADGLSLGRVTRGTLTTPLDDRPGDRTNVVVFNLGPEEHVALRMDVAFVAATDDSTAARREGARLVRDAAAAKAAELGVPA